MFGHEVVVALRLEPVEFGAPLRWARHAGITYTQSAQLRPYPVSGTVRVAVAAAAGVRPAAASGRSCRSAGRAAAGQRPAQRRRVGHAPARRPLPPVRDLRADGDVPGADVPMTLELAAVAGTTLSSSRMPVHRSARAAPRRPAADCRTHPLPASGGELRSSSSPMRAPTMTSTTAQRIDPIGLILRAPAGGCITRSGSASGTSAGQRINRAPLMPGATAAGRLLPVSTSAPN